MRPKEEWRRDVYRRYAALSKLTQEHAKLQFLRILKSLPYGNSVFFSVRRTEDPIGLLPSKLILGINKRGVHFFRPVPKEYLHSVEMRDIMHFGSSSRAVYFKMKVAGVLHVFQFETRQGDDISLALQTHISDIMIRRYNKTLGQRQSAKASRLAQADFGPKYDQHLKQMQKHAEEHSHRIEELEQAEKDALYKVQEMRNELGGIRENITAFEQEKAALQADLSAARKSYNSTKEKLNEVKAVRVTLSMTGMLGD